MLVSARPAALRRVAQVGAEADVDVVRAGRRLSGALARSGAGTWRPPAYRSLGDDVVRLASSWSALEAWVGRVGGAFERADAGRGLIGPPSPVVSAPEVALGLAGEGPTWVDTLSDAEAEATALRLAGELRGTADRITGIERSQLRARLWPLVRRLRERWPEASFRNPSSSSVCATPPPRPPDGLEEAIRLLHLAGPGRVPHTAGVAEAFGDGFLGGEASASYDNLGGEVARTAGHVTSGVLVFGDVRDGLVEGSRGNWLGVGLAIGGLVPGAGDFLKGGKAIDEVIDARRVVIDLAKHDDWGGHGALKHIGLSDAQLRQRLLDEPKIPAASTFVDTTTATDVATSVVAENQGRIDDWLQGQGSQLHLDRRFADPVGRVLSRGGELAEARDVRLVIRRSPKSPSGWYIHTMRIEP